MRAGEVHVLALPDADRDVDPHYRPRLEVAEGVVRVVASGPGRVDADAVLPPAAGARCRRARGASARGAGACGGPGTAGAPDAPPEVTGWADDVPAAVPGRRGVPRGRRGGHLGGPGTARGAAHVRTGWVAADLVVGGATAVATRFAGPVDLVAVAMEGGDGDDLAIGIEGARRATGPDGTPEPPVLVADGPRAVAVFRVRRRTRPPGRDGPPARSSSPCPPARRAASPASPPPGARRRRARDRSSHRASPPSSPTRCRGHRRRRRPVEGALMPALPPGHFRLVPFVEPPVPAGSYLLTGDVAGMPGAVEPLRSRVEIAAPRYAMPPDQILSTFPPAGARGSFTSRLPQIVLRRRTLPWERSADLDGDVTTTPTPWLALVLIAEGEGAAAHRRRRRRLRHAAASTSAPTPTSPRAPASRSPRGRRQGLPDQGGPAAAQPRPRGRPRRHRARAGRRRRLPRRRARQPAAAARRPLPRLPGQPRGAVRVLPVIPDAT